MSNKKSGILICNTAKDRITFYELTLTLLLRHYDIIKNFLKKIQVFELLTVWQQTMHLF